MNLITLTTDFGTRDSYVAQMKGVIAGIAPSARVLDVTHDVPPQDVAAASLIVAQIAATFPPGTVHVVVVDPGVGTQRRILAAELDGQRFVLPDNGILTRVWHKAAHRRLVELTNAAFWRRVQSQTFHGRDRMAPVAAHWITGTPLERFGPPLREPPVLLDLSEPRREHDRIVGQIVYVDHFGNLATNVPGRDVQGRRVRAIQAGPLLLHDVCRTYADVAAGEPLALVNSSGMLELAVNQGNAAEQTGLRPGDPVVVLFDHAPTAQ